MKKYYSLIFVLGSYLALDLFSIRKFLSYPGTLGHNWDWSIPILPSQLKYLSNISSFIWNDCSLGADRLWGGTCFLLNKMIGSLGYVGIGGDFISKGLVVLVIILSALGMYALLMNILEEDTGVNSGLARYGAFIGGLFYGFSPYLFNELIGGANTQFFTYALFPFAVLFYRQYVIKGGAGNFILLLVSLSLISMSLQRLILLIVLLGFYTVFVLPPRKVLWKRLFALGVFYLLLNLYWIVPLVIEMKSFSLISGLKEFGYVQRNIKEAVPSLTQIFVGTGYFRPFFTLVIKYYRVWTLIVYLFVAIVLYSVIRFARNKRTLFWSAGLLVSIIFATGGKPPLGGFILWLYREFPVMNLFRTPQHFIILPIFFLAIILGEGIIYISQLLDRIFKVNLRRLVYVGAIIGIMFWLNPFFIHGDLGTNILKRNFRGGNYIDNYRLSPGYETAGRLFAKEKNVGRLLPLPMAGSPYYRRAKYQSEGQGGDPFIISSPMPCITSDLSVGLAKAFSGLMERAATDASQSKSLYWLSRITGVRYIFLRKDVVPNFGHYVRKWNWQKAMNLLSVLENRDKIEKVYSADYVEIYKLCDPLPLVYIPDNVYIIDGAVDGIGDICNFISVQKDEAPVFISLDQQTSNFPDRYAVINSHKSEHFVNLFDESEGYSSRVNIPAKDGKYLITSKLSLNTVNVEKRNYGWNYKFSRKWVEQWKFKLNNTEFSSYEIPRRGTKITALFDGDSKEDEYLQMKYDGLNVDLKKYPCFRMLYRLQEPDVQVIEIILGLDFNGDMIPDAYTPGAVYASSRFNMWSEFKYNFYRVAKRLYPDKKEYRVIELELYPHKLWKVDCSGNKRRYYRFWIDKIGFYDSFEMGSYFEIDRKVLDIKFDKGGIASILENKNGMVQDVNVKHSDKFVYLSLFTKPIDIYKFPLLKLKYKVTSFVKTLECVVYIEKNSVGESFRVPLGTMPLFRKMNSFDIRLDKGLMDKFNLSDKYFIIRIELELKVSPGYSGDRTNLGDFISFKKLSIGRRLMVLKKAFLFRDYIFSVDGEKYFFKKQFKDEDDREGCIFQKKIDLKEGSHSIEDVLVDNPNFRCDWIMVSSLGAKGIVPRMKFKKINPTRYDVSIENPKEPLWLVLSQTYNKGWKAEVLMPNGKHCFLKKHYIVNGYANGWWLDEDTIKLRSSNNGKVNLTLEYKPQKWFHWCLRISSGIFLGIIIWFFVRFVVLHFRKRIDNEKIN